MQTFVPDPLFAKCAEVLDNKRLGKQRVETLQIAKAVFGGGSGWINHPVVKMWIGHPEALMAYQTEICNRWTDELGFRDTCLQKTADIMQLEPRLQSDLDIIEWPRWIGRADVHRSHRSNLLRKLPDHYRRFWPSDPDDLPYVWPLSWKAEHPELEEA